jgi:hypothetical protein
MYFTVDVNGGETRFPAQDYYELSVGEEKIINAFVFSEPSLSQSLTINVHVWDDDAPLSSDDLGQFTDVHDPTDNFGDTGEMGVDNCYYRDVGDWSFWYWVETGAPPKEPSLRGPLNEQSFNSSLPVFSWTFNPGTDQNQGAFCVQIDDSAQFTSVEITSGDMESSLKTWTPSGLDDGTWYWRICTRDSSGAWGNWSGSRVFMLDRSPPSVNLVYPTGGEKLYGNVSIKVMASDSISGVARVDFYYKIGSNYVYIGSQIETTANYYQMSWDTSVIPEDTSYHIRVVGFNDVGLSREDRTDLFIEIDQPETPFIELLSPVGNENLSGYCEVRWRSYDNDADDSLLFRIALSVDGGEFFSNVTGWLTEKETGTVEDKFNYSLDLAAFKNASTYRIRVTVTDSSPLTPDVYDTTVENFSIYHPIMNYPPLVSIEYPLRGSFTVEIRITYNASDRNEPDILSIAIWFQAKGGHWQLISAQMENTGEFSWNLAGIPEGLYKLRIEANDGKVNGSSEMDDFSLSIYRNNPPCAVILAPQNGSVFNNRSPISFISGAYDPDDNNISVRWSSDVDGVLYEGDPITFSITLSLGAHNIRFRVWDEYGLVDEQRIVLHISEYDFLFYSDIYVENITLPSKVSFGDVVMINVSIRNLGNLGGNVSFILRAVPDYSGVNPARKGSLELDQIEIFHDVVVIAAGEVYFRMVTWIPDSPGYYLIEPIIMDHNSSNDGTPFRIEIYESHSTADLEGEQLLEPFFYAYPLVIFLVVLFFGIVIFHRIKRRRIEKQAIIDELMETGKNDPGLDIDVKKMEPSTDLISQNLCIDKDGISELDQLETGLPGSRMETDGIRANETDGLKDINIIKAMSDIIADFEEDCSPTSGIHADSTPVQSKKGDEALPELKKMDDDILSMEHKKNGSEKLPKRVMEIFEGL